MLRGPKAPTTSADHQQIVLLLLLNSIHFSTEIIVSFSAFQIIIRFRGECASSSFRGKKKGTYSLYVNSSFLFKTQNFAGLFLLPNTVS